MFLLDGIVGPLLETLGIIEIDEMGEWSGKKKTPKKEEPRKESGRLRKRLVGWFRQLVGWLKGLFIHSEIKKLDKTIHEGHLTDEVKKMKSAPEETPLNSLKRISKEEGLSLARKEGYKVSYGDTYPKATDIEDEVVYIVEGRGDPAFYSPWLGNIRRDAYYIKDYNAPLIIHDPNNKVFLTPSVFFNDNEDND